MNKAGAQSVPRSSLPFSTKDEAKKWLELVVAAGLPKDLHEKAVNLDRKINTKGQPWDELKSELETLHSQFVQFDESQQRQQILQVGIPAPVLRDPRVDALVQKYQELEIAKQLKVEVTADMENAKMRLKADIGDNYDKINKLKSDLAERDETIAHLRNKVEELTKEKEALEKKIKSLENEIVGLKRHVSELQFTAAETDKKIEKLMQMHDDRIQKLQGDWAEESQDTKKKIKALESRNEALENRNEALEQMIASRIVVGETMKIAIKAIYKHVHPNLPHRKRRGYAVDEISDHISLKYSNPDEKMAAQSRWDKLKDCLDWNEDTEEIIQELIDKRNETAHRNPPVDKIEFRDALRQMKEKNDIEDEVEGVAYGIYVQCHRKFNI